MAAPLQHKQRVRLPDEPWTPVTGRRRRAPFALAGIALWLGLALLCYAIATGAVPLARWLGGARAPLALRRAQSQPRPLRAAVVPAAAFGQGGAGSGSAPSVAGSAIEPASGGNLTPPAPTQPTPLAGSPGIDPFAATDGIGARARDTGEATVDDAPTMATSSGVGHKSCEDAIAADQDRNGPDENTDARVSKVVDNGRWFKDCGSVKLFEVHVCVAVRNGRAVGVTARTLPAHRAIVTCIANQAWALRFPHNPKLVVARASFAPD